MISKNRKIEIHTVFEPAFRKIREIFEQAFKK